MNRKVRNTAIAFSSVALYGILLDSFIEKYFHRSDSKERIFPYSEKTEEKIKNERPSQLEWFESIPKEEISIRSYDGLELSGLLLENNESNDYIIYSHGSGTNLMGGLDLYYHMSQLGYNILAYDQRACGKSEGKYGSMGKLESLDLIAWIHKLVECKPDSNITLIGTSMGAAAINLALKTKLPENVKHVVSDSSYATFENVIKKYIQNLGIFSLPVLASFKLMLEMRLEIRMEDLNCAEALRHNRIPILFVHGRNDAIVDFSEMRKLYNANTEGIRKYYPIDNAGHGECRYSENYYSNIDRFIKEVN